MLLAEIWEQSDINQQVSQTYFGEKTKANCKNMIILRYYY